MGFYILLILIVLVFWFYFTNRSQPNYSVSELNQAIEKDTVSSVTIQQNREVPTGEGVRTMTRSIFSTCLM